MYFFASTRDCFVKLLSFYRISVGFSTFYIYMYFSSTSAYTFCTAIHEPEFCRDTDSSRQFKNTDNASIRYQIAQNARLPFVSRAHDYRISLCALKTGDLLINRMLLRSLSVKIPSSSQSKPSDPRSSHAPAPSCHGRGR